MCICLNVDHITKQYGGRNVLNQVSFQVKKGEIFGLLGHNGAGKSTLLDCILGLTITDEGSSTIFDLQVKENRSMLFERIGVQFQHSNYQKQIRVFEVCKEMAALYKQPIDINILLRQFHLEPFKKQYVSLLSGGEKQKLSLLVAMIHNPEIVFLDELTTGLDVGARRVIWKLIQELKKQGKTIFLTTHMMEEAAYLCDHILLLKQGTLVAEGSVTDLIQRSPYETLEEAYLWYMDEEELV